MNKKPTKANRDNIFTKMLLQRDVIINEKAEQVFQLEMIIEDLKKELNQKNSITTMHEANEKQMLEAIYQLRAKEGKKAKPTNKYIKMLIGVLISYALITFVTLNANLFDWSNTARIVFLLMAVYLGRK
tara:strand:+ start:4124 stop:4510 length:387 start_codon:yes stop_codon:yes gene_type:complete